MDSRQLVRELLRNGIIRLAKGTPLPYLDEAEPLYTARGMNGSITIHLVEGSWLVQEPVPGGDRMVRAYTERAEADEFIRRRMEQFDRLWDGCGCRIDYEEFEPSW